MKKGSLFYKELAAERKKMYQRRMRNSFFFFGVFAIAALAAAYPLISLDLSVYALVFWGIIELIFAPISLIALFDAGFYRAAKIYDPRLVLEGGRRSELYKDYSEFLQFHNEAIIKLTANYAEAIIRARNQAARNNPTQSDESEDKKNKN